jgi:PR domain zinc finger protein 8
MTMDIANDLRMSPNNLRLLESQQQREIKTQTKLPMKRSFDVAFLMLPDEKLKRREQVNSSPELDVTASNSPTELSVRSDLMNRYHQMNRAINNNKVFFGNDYTAMFKTSEDRYSSGSLNSTASSERSEEISDESPRSAFSKVSQIINVDSPVPPHSPDHLSCSSASPPISYSPPSVPHTFRPDYSHFINSGAFQAIHHPGFSPNGKYKPVNYRNPIQNSHPPAAMNHGNQDPNHIQHFQLSHSNQQAAAFMTQPEQFIRNPAAAILSTLLPSTIGALTLPAQNVCAKCNISFRMTSDLVYHMRSHHKNESGPDLNKRKREDKLKCPVCQESFRERHHLTRHMTAHNDKEGDLIDSEIAEYHSRRK